jgi:pimeloyl-ACP methyl ester carboxylesterase
MMKKALLLLAASLLATSVAAQDRPLDAPGSKAEDGGPKQGRPAASSAQPFTLTASPSRSSPIPTPTPTDTHFVADEGPGLDTGCRYRSAGSLKFTVSVTRYVGQVGGDGTLSNAQALVNNGVVSANATLSMPAFDVDFNATPPAPYYPERDRILFNGHPVGDLNSGAYLNGENNRWRVNDITVPIEYVRFAQRGPHGGEPTPGQNEIEILVDQANVPSGTDVWCTAIDWAAIKFDALAPVVMIHGNGESGAFWDRLNFTRPFQQAGVPYDNSISVPTTFIAENARTLAGEIPRVAREFGTKHIHIVAHSKGGLDTRAFLKLLPTEGQLAVMSLTTLSTPHHGSALADYVRDAQGASWWHSEDATRTQMIQRFGGAFDNGRRNLTTDFIQQQFNPSNLPLPQSFTVDGEESGVNYFSYGADANLDNSFNFLGNPTIQENELAGTGHQNDWFAEEGGNLIYRLLYYVSSTRWAWRVVGGQRVRIVRETPNQQVQPNDFLVTINSSRLPGFLARPDQLRNHATIADEGIGGLVFNLIRSLQPMQ